MEAERLTGQRQGHWRHKQGQTGRKKVRHGRVREGRQRKGGAGGQPESWSQGLRAGHTRHKGRRAGNINRKGEGETEASRGKGRDSGAGRETPTERGRIRGAEEERKERLTDTQRGRGTLRHQVETHREGDRLRQGEKD